MEDNRKLKTLMFGIVDGTNKRGRPCREWMNDIVSWCKTGLLELNSLAQDSRRWKLITRQAVDTNGRWSPWFLKKTYTHHRQTRFTTLLSPIEGGGKGREL